MNDVIKVGAIALGAYMLYSSLAKKAGGNSGSTTEGSSSSASSAEYRPAGVTDADLASAAADQTQASRAQGAKLSVHAWNYYRRTIGPLPAPAPEDIGLGDGNTPITAEQYHAALAAHQLAGFALEVLRG